MIFILNNVSYNDFDLLYGDVFSLSEIQGVSQTSSINSTSIAGFDGASYVSEQVEKRVITLIVSFAGQENIEACRRQLNSIFRIKKEGVLKYSDDLRELSIKGRVISVEMPISVKNFNAQIQLECLDPYFYADEITHYIAATVGAFEFEFELDDTVGFEFGEISESLVTTVENNGEVPTGCIFRLKALGNCSNPKIQNADSFDWIQINADMIADDEIIINTYTGQKSVTFIRKNVAYNYINYKQYGSKFLQLAVGENIFVYSAGEYPENLEISCTFSEKYGGV